MATILLILFAFLVISAAGIYSLFERDLSAAPSRLIGLSKIIDMSFGKLGYALMGGASRYWLSTAPAVAFIRASTRPTAWPRTDFG